MITLLKDPLKIEKRNLVLLIQFAKVDDFGTGDTAMHSKLNNFLVFQLWIQI
jgi:hypothetical protein